jgi:hypothetical protein
LAGTLKDGKLHLASVVNPPAPAPPRRRAKPRARAGARPRAKPSTTVWWRAPTGSRSLCKPPAATR